MRKKSLYLQIMACFLVLVLLIGVVAAVTYIAFVRQQQRDFQEQIRSNMRSVHESFSQYVYNICGIKTLFFDLPFVQTSFVQKNTAKQKLDRKQVVDAIQNCVNSQTKDILVEIFAYCGDEVFFQQGISDAKRFYSYEFCFEEYDMDFWMEKLQNRGMGMQILKATRVKQRESVWKNVLPVLNYEYCNGCRSVFVALCSVDAMARMYEQTAVFHSSKYVIMDGNGKIVYDPDGLLSSVQENFAPSDVHCRIGNVTYNVLSENYALFDWQVLCLTPTTAFLRLGEFYILVATAVCVGLILLAVMLSFVFSRRIYLPILTLNRHVAGIVQDNVASSGNELSDLLQNVMSVMESNSQVKKLQSCNAQQYAKARILEVLDGHFISDEQNLLEVLRIEYGFEYPYLGCALYENEGKIKHIPENVRAMWIAHHSGVLILIYNQQQPEVNDMLCDEGFRFGVGAPLIGIHNLYVSFEQAANLFVKRGIVPLDEEFNEAVFGMLLKRRDADGACHMVEALLARLETAWPGYSEARRQISMVYDGCIRLLGANLYRCCEVLRMEANRFIDVLLAGERFSPEPLNEFVRMTLSLFPEHDSPHGNYDLAQGIREYIDAHYFEDLSLTILGDRMGISDKYVSRVFKNEFQVNVTDYIAMVRIGHAKQLMRKGISVAAAAHQVGIESRTTFIRTFRKLEGITPSEFQGNANR